MKQCRSTCITRHFSELNTETEAFTTRIFTCMQPSYPESIPVQTFILRLTSQISPNHRISWKAIPLSCIWRNWEIPTQPLVRNLHNSPHNFIVSFLLPPPNKPPVMNLMLFRNNLLSKHSMTWLIELLVPSRQSAIYEHFWSVWVTKSILNSMISVIIYSVNHFIQVLTFQVYVWLLLQLSDCKTLWRMQRTAWCRKLKMPIRALNGYQLLIKI